MLVQSRVTKLLDSFSYFFLALNIFLVPLFLDKNLNNFYIIPKQYVFGGLILISLILLVIKFVLTKKFIFSRSILDKPLLMILIVGLLSAVFSSNPYDSFFGRADFFSLSYISLFFGIVFYYIVINSVHTEKSWRGLVDIFLASGFLSMVFFILKSVVRVKFLDSWFGVGLNTVDILNSLFGLWVIMIFILSFGQLIRKDLNMGRSITYFFIGMLAFSILFMLNFKILWWILLASLVLMLLLGINFLREARLPWLSALFAFLVLTIIFIIFGVPKNLQVTAPTEVALGFKSSWSVTYDTLLSGIKPFLLGSGATSFGVDFSKFRDTAFNSDSVAWSLRFSQPYSTALGLIAENGLFLPIAFVFLILLFLGHALTAWNKMRAADLIKTGHAKKKDLLFEIFLVVIALLILSGGSLFLFYNQVIWMLWFLFLALSICGLAFYHRHFVSEYSWTMEDTPQYNLSFSFGMIVATTALVMISVFGARLYWGEIAYAQSLRSADLHKAEDYIKDAIDKHANSDTYHAALAQIYLNQAVEKTKVTKPDVQSVSDLMAKAVNEAKLATDLSPQSVVLWENLVTMYENAAALVPDARDWSIKTLQQVIVLEPTNPVHYWRLGNSYVAQAKWDDAAKNYQKAVDLKADYYGAYLGLANVYEQTQKNDQAMAIYEKLINSKQANPEILYNYGRLLYNRNAQGDRDLAQKIWLNIIQAQPNYSNAIYSLGLWYETHGDRNTALQYYNKVRDLNPNNQDILKKIQSLVGAQIDDTSGASVIKKKK